eukprot:gene3971-6428_t
MTICCPKYPMLSLFFGSLSRHAPSGILRLPLIRGIMSDADWRAFVSPPANENADIPPFHHAFPVDFNLFGHQIVAHRSDTPPKDHFNPVDGDDVPVPHFGCVLSWDGFDRLAERLKEHNVKFIIKPHVRFAGLAGEQKTMFFKDPSGNNLEFKAMRNPSYLFQKN